MEMKHEDLSKLLEIRKSLVLQFESFRDYKMNPNALMKEIDHVHFLGKIIVEIDDFLKSYVKFN